jgi:AcrR family transcriptional regulator
MVMRYFGNKDQLFAAAAEFDLRFPDFTELDRAEVGRLLVGHFLQRWEAREDGEALVILMRSSATNDAAAQRMQHIFSTQLQPLVERLAPGTTSAESARRAGLIATQILGIAWCRFVLRLPAVVAMTSAEIVDEVGQTIQRYLGLADN